MGEQKTVTLKQVAEACSGIYINSLAVLNGKWWTFPSKLVTEFNCLQYWISQNIDFEC